MSSFPLYSERFRRPVIGLTELIRKNQGGLFREKDEYTPFMFRALVIAVDVEGGKLENVNGRPDGTRLEMSVRDRDGSVLARYPITPTKGPRNPKNSVRARVVSGDLDQFIDDDNLRTYWPMFPGADNPSPGELVYVVFEDSSYIHGLWLAKVPNNLVDDNANQILMSDALKDAHNSKITLYPDANTDDSRDAMTNAPRDPQRLSKLFSRSSSDQYTETDNLGVYPLPPP